MNSQKNRLQPVRLDAYKPLREVVREALRQAIKDGILKPGERLMEIQLAEELGVSRTPIREAIRKLELDGFVVMIPRRGTYVADISLKDISQEFEIRTALEELASGLGAVRITEEELEYLERMLVEIGDYIEEGDMDKIVAADVGFHEVLYKASRNNRLAEIIHNLREQLMRFRSISMNQPGRLANTWEEHRQLVEAIASRNASQARKIARLHMENSEQVLIVGMGNKDVARMVQEGFEPKEEE